MAITLEQARTLDAVARCGSYAKAAKILHKGHSAVIYSLKTLEEQLGLVLFDRSEYRSSLTSAGKRVLEECRKLLVTEAELEAVCLGLKSGWEPELHIVYDGLLPLEPIFKALAKVREAAESTRIYVYSEFLTGVENLFHSLSAQIMLSILPPEDKELKGMTLSPLKAYLVAHKSHLLCKSRKHLSVDDLKGQTFLTVRGSDLRLKLSTSELDRVSTFHLSDFVAKKVALMDGLGFGWMPEHMIASELKSKNLQVIKWEKGSVHSFSPRLFHVGRDRLGNAAKIFLSELEKTAR